LLLATALWQIGSQALAQTTDAVCAEVKIVIEQKLSLERQAFDARMIITNGLADQNLENVQIELQFLDANNNPVAATADPNATGALFFYRTDHISGIDSLTGGVINAGEVADINWLIIPAAGAAGNESKGKLYYIGAKLTYTLEGRTQTVEVTPEFIVVRPQPQLALDYFLPQDVYGDDAFTAEVEAPEPFTLGVRVRNIGMGTSFKTTLDTAQIKIVENDLGLLIGFEIIGSFVADRLAGKSLLLDFGDIEGGATAVGRWNMATTLSGKFVGFDASFSHADDLGGAVTSLISQVQTHMLVHDVRVDLPGRDAIRDFLARDGNVLRIYESDGVDTEVTDRSAQAVFKQQGDGTATLGFPAVAQGLAYAKVSDPYRGARSIAQILRSDGRPVPPENVWLSRERDDNLQWHYYINLFDANTDGQYHFGLVASEEAQISGLVYQDNNGNGIRDQNEPAIGVAAIQLQGAETASGAAVSVTAHTGVDGRFQFVNLKPGLYSLSIAEIAGLLDGPSLAGPVGGTATPGLISGIQLGAGVHAQNYVFSKRKGVATNADEEQADLAVALQASRQSVHAGETFTLTLKPSSKGPATASDAAVQLNLPDHLAIRSHQASHGQVESPGANGVRWSIGALAPDALPVLTLDVEVLVTHAKEIVIGAMIGSALADPASSDNSRTIHIQIEDAQAIVADQVLRQGPRVLLYIGCPNAATGCPAEQSQSAQELFANHETPVFEATNMDVYWQALRSGGYNLLWVHGDVSQWPQQLLAETRAAVMRGASLVLDGAPHAHSQALANLWGGGYGAAPMQNTQALTIDGVSVPLVGQAWQLEPSQADVVGRYADGSPAIVSATAGLGRVHAAGFEVLGSNLSQPALAQWMGDQLQQHLAPQIVEPMLAGSSVELITTVRNGHDQTQNMQLATWLPAGASLIQATPTPTAGQTEPILWERHYDARQEALTTAQIRLPQQALAFTLQSSLTHAETSDVIGDWSFALRTLDLAGAQQQIDSLLQAAGSASSGAVLDEVRANVDATKNAVAANQTEQAITELAAAFARTDALQDLPQQRALQIALSQWLGLLAASSNGGTSQPAYAIDVHSGTGQSAQVGSDYAQHMTARVTNGQQPAAGVQVLFTLPSSGPSAQFASGALTALVVTDANGLAHSPVLQANGTTGAFEATAQLTLIPSQIARYQFTNLASSLPQPLQLQVIAGQDQSGVIQTAYAQALQVRIVDALGQPVVGHSVRFAAPASGASITFPGAIIAVEVSTDAQGIATAPQMHANAQPGAFSVLVTAPQVQQSVAVHLSNLASGQTSSLNVQILSGSGQAAPVNTTFASDLVVQVRNVQGQVVAGQPVRFTAPDTGASAAFASGVQIEVTTDAQGIARASAPRANALTGSYAVTASVQGGASVQFALSNLAAATGQRQFSAPTPTGTGVVKASISGGGAQCQFNHANTALKRPEDIAPILGTLLFPHGVFDFELIDCNPGSAVTVTIEWPHWINITGYLQYGPTPTSSASNIWYAPQKLSTSGATTSHTITDGGWGDDDLLTNGILRAAGGPAIQSGPLPNPNLPSQNTNPIPIGGTIWLLWLALSVLWLARWRLCENHRNARFRQ
jgi:hypothetical protein